MYLKISISDFLTVFSARTAGPFWIRRPGIPLLCAAGFSLAISTLLAAYGPFGTMEGLASDESGRGWDFVGLVWLYCVVWWFIQDACKVLAYKAMDCFTMPRECDTEDVGNIDDVRRKSKLRQSLAHYDAESRRASRMSTTSATSHHRKSEEYKPLVTAS